MNPSFADQFAAKAFFVDRIVARANEERKPLTRAEAYQLNWTEVEPGCETVPELDAEFERETNSADYEEKIKGLIERAYLADVDADPGAIDRYRAAYDLLSKHDHYVLIMIGDAIESYLRRKRRWLFW